MRLIGLLFLLISVSGSAQWKDFILTPKGDTLNRVDMNGKKQGPWVIKVPDLRGERGYEEEGYFENDAKEGEWKRFSLDGVKIAQENYRWGKLNGKQYYFTYNGGLMREESWRAIDPANPFDTVSVYDLKDPSKEIDRVVVKNDGLAMKHGKWTYYDPREGTVEATEYYVMNKLRTEDDEMIADDDLRPIDISKGKAKSDTATSKTTQKPQVVLDYEKKNSGKKKIKVRDGSTGNLPKP
ncbi:MAG: toxin-antitoxin system YwqK family antitoxin [Bacteroidota bacterium]